MQFFRENNGEIKEAIVIYEVGDIDKGQLSGRMEKFVKELYGKFKKKSKEIIINNFWSNSQNKRILKSQSISKIKQIKSQNKD